MIALAAALVLAPAAAPARPAAAPADVVDAVRACVAATSPAGVDEARLTAAGFQPGAATAGGRAVETPLRFFGRPAGRALILVGPGRSGGDRLCTATAPVATGAGRNDVATALTRAYGRPVETGRNVVWRTDRHLIALDATGTDAQPAVRVGVVNRPQENQ